MKQRNLDVYIHHTMAVCGGFLGIYAILARFNVFGSAQTANLMGLIRDLVGRNFIEVAIRLGACIIYVLAIILATILEKRVKRIQIVTIVLEIVVVGFLGIIPRTINPMIALYPMFFITAFQWCIFKGAKGYVSSTIFSTNNIKQTVVSFTEYYLLEENKEKERKEKLEKAKFFAGSLLAFHMGALCSALLYPLFGIQTVWCCIVPLVFSMTLILYQESQEKNIMCVESIVK
ncbi:MAG: DUF1275 domain-containing protein [Clostridiales bacterium]|nr:DUF1275 domain-containing protein [Clostridiales bacterium]